MRPAAKNRNQPFAAWIALMSAVFVTSSIAGETSDPGDSSRRPAWTTSRVFGTPEPPPPYTTERAFTSLKFDKCLELVTAPGSNRLFVVEQSGKVYSFPDRDDVDQADLVIDFAKANPDIKQVYSLAFHPDFRQNRYCYVCYIKANALPDGTQVSRFVMADAETPTIDFATETPLLSWLSGGHNGCCLRFGPDGYLYISTGDGGPANPPDPLQTGQNLDDFLSVVLRIDVDQTEPGRNYKIPADNPFVDVEGARGEIWAYGLRNPWRISFDQKTGDFWVGDVGWEAWEMLYRVEKGGNYGWAVMEGPQAVNPQWQRGPTPILPPTVQLPHSESSSITEGFTYYGTRLPELDGTHIYGDYDTGKVWGFRFEDGNVVDHRPIAATSHRIVSFGENTRGDVLIVDHIGGTLHRLVPQPPSTNEHPFPRKLSETGLFASTADSAAAPGVVAYGVNAAMWSDFAEADRWVAVPEQLTIQPRNDWAMWTFPKDSVLVKTLSMEMRRGDPNSLRRIETQILHFDGSNWMPYTYQWNDDQTDASLVAANGLDIELEVEDPFAPESLRKQVWRFAGRAECQRCHNKWSGPALAFNTFQFLGQPAKASPAGDQIDNFVRTGLIASHPHAGDRKPLVDPYNASEILEDRARAYLHVNCAHCHRMHAGGSVLSFMHADLPLEKANMIGWRPTQGTFGIDGAEVIAAGDPFRSVLLYRMAKLGNGRMPHIGSSEVDIAGVDLLAQWIETLGVDRPQTATEAGGSESQQRASEIKALSELRAAGGDPATRQRVESLIATPGGALRLVRSLHQKQVSPAIESMAIEIALAQDDVGIRGLFEPFLPPDQRARRLGAVVQPEQILGLSGDASRGEKLFHATTGITCVNCHRIGQAGKEVGPDLTLIGKKLNRAQLLESILEPSKTIDPSFVTWLVVTDDGRAMTGMVIERTDQRVSIKDAQGQVHRIAQASIEQMVAQPQSMMPDLLAQDMTAQQLADLLEYLGSLR
jgi:putative heme-binding domain-containing protein